MITIKLDPPHVPASVHVLAALQSHHADLLTRADAMRRAGYVASADVLADKAEKLARRLAAASTKGARLPRALVGCSEAAACPPSVTRGEQS